MGTAALGCPVERSSTGLAYLGLPSIQLYDVSSFAELRSAAQPGAAVPTRAFSLKSGGCASRANRYFMLMAGMGMSELKMSH